MKKAVKSSLTLIVAFIMSLVSANTSFAAFINIVFNYLTISSNSTSKIRAEYGAII